MNRQVNQQHLNTYVTVTQITVTLYKTISYIRSPPSPHTAQQSQRQIKGRHDNLVSEYTQKQSK